MSITAEDVQNALRATARDALADAARNWTTRVLQALAKLASSELCIDPDMSLETGSKGRRANEFIWDLTISTWPRYDVDKRYRYPAYFEAAAARPAKLLLVAESEWGHELSPTKNGREVLEDFAKLLAARAPLKVMVFGYHVPKKESRGHTSSFAELTELMERLIVTSEDPNEYVLFGVAWQGQEFRDLRVTAGKRGAEVIGPA